MDSIGLSTLNILRKGRSTLLPNRDGIALVYGERHYSYAELNERAHRLAAGLLDVGLRKGDRVAVLAYNRPEWFEILFALAQIGAVMVPLNYYLKENEARYILDDSGARLAFVEDKLHESVAGALGECEALKTVVAIGKSTPGARDYESVLAATDHAEVDVEVSLQDPLLLQYTSGTTGFPKGATHTHSTVLWNSFHQLFDLRVTRHDTYLLLPALCWAAGFHDFTLATLWAGGKVVLAPSLGFEPEAMLEMIERHRVTKVIMVASVLNRVLDSPSLDNKDLSSLELVLTGGEPVPVPTIEGMQERLPSVTLIQGYGMSEFPAAMLLLDQEFAIAKRGSAGRAVSVADVRVVDTEGCDVEPGEVGEIICRSPATMVGYWGKPEATAETLRDGWLHSGDMARVDEDGFVYIVGRAKDMYISGGLNVYPAEIERVLSQHPDVMEAAVVGVPDSKWGEVGKAVVVVDSNRTVTEEALRAHVSSELANYKVPRSWELRTEALPRNASNKVQKFKLRQESTTAKQGYG